MNDLKKAVYREEGGKYLVEVLKDEVESDGFRRIEVRCVKVLRPSRIMGDIEPGETWQASVKNGVSSIMAGWDLADPTPGELS